jgi:ABC-type phosphate transport system substrate-binding protein
MHKKILLGLVVFLAYSASLAAAEIKIIVNVSVAETTLSKKNIEDIFLGKIVQWKDNAAIHVVAVKDPKVHHAFLEQYLKKTETQWNAYWKRLVFTGTGTPPEQAETQQAVLEYVAKTKGAIGYIEATELAIDTIKILEVK